MIRRGCAEDHVPPGMEWITFKLFIRMDILGKSVNGGWNAVGGVYTPPSQPDLEIDQYLRELRWRWVLPGRFHPMFIQDLLCYCYLCYIKEKDNGGGTFEHIQKRYFLKYELLLNR